VRPPSPPSPALSTAPQLTPPPKAYGIVHRALDTRTSTVVALKHLRIHPSERHNGIPLTALREISILRSLKHANIVNALDVAVAPEELDDVYMVMEYCEQVGHALLVLRGACRLLAGLLRLCRKVEV